MKNIRQPSAKSVEGTSPPRGSAPRSPLDWAANAGAVGDVLIELEARLKRRRRQRVRRIAGMTLGLFVIGLGGYLTVHEPASDGRMTPDSALVSIPRRQTLPDGSLVEFRHDARIEVAYTDSLRRVVLDRGEVHFQVAKNQSRPFVVSAGGVDFRAVGTAFTVCLRDRKVEMFVSEGRVAVESGRAKGIQDGGLASQPPAVGSTADVLVVDARNHVMVDIAAPEIPVAVVNTISESELSQRLSWRAPKLDFSGTPLEEAIEMINRHAMGEQRVRLVLGDPSLATVQISGILRADNISTLLDVLESEYGIKAERRSATEIVLLKIPATREPG